MALYDYRAIDEQSVVHQGRLNAASTNDIERILSGQGLTLIEAERSGFINFGELFAIRFSQKDLLDFTYMLNMVICSGISILNGLRDLAKGHSNKKMKHVSDILYQGLDAGVSISEVMESQPSIFPPFYVHMVRAGEVSGTLENSLQFLMNYLNWQIEFRKTIRGALSYPITVLVIMGFLMVIIFTVVFPKMLKLLSGLGADMPLPTKIMMVISGVMRNHFFTVAAIAIMLFIAYTFFKRTDRGQYLIDGAILKLPVIGMLVRKINLSRYFKIVATLHASGVNADRTFTIGAEVIGNRVLSESLMSIADALRTGESISDAMRRTGYIQDLVADMVSFAEKTGRLEDALNRASDILDKEVPETIKKLVSLIEPVTMAALGGLVLMLLLSVFLPIYKVVGHLKVK